MKEKLKNNFINLIFTPIFILVLSCSQKESLNKEISRKFEINKILAFQNQVQIKYNNVLKDTLISIFNDSSFKKDIFEIHKESGHVIDKIHTIIDFLINESGGYNSDGSYKGGYDMNLVETYFINNPKNAENLQNHLNSFSDLLNRKGFKTGRIAPIGKDNIVYKFDKRFIEKEWGYVYFKNSTVIEVITTLRYFIEEVLKAEEKYYINKLIRANRYN